MTDQSQFILILEAKIKRLEAALAERNEKIKGMQNVIDRYRAEVRGRKAEEAHHPPGARR